MAKFMREVIRKVGGKCEIIGGARGELLAIVRAVAMVMSKLSCWDEHFLIYNKFISANWSRNGLGLQSIFTLTHTYIPYIYAFKFNN